MKKIPIQLAPNEKVFLEKKKREKLTKRQRDRIEILLLCHKKKSEKDIADFLGITTDTVWRTKKRYHEQGVGALEEKKRPGAPKKYRIREETELTALACSDPPEGHARWTLQLLMEKMRSDVQGCEKIQRQNIFLMLKKIQQNRG